jgi:hypothetical protein
MYKLLLAVVLLLGITSVSFAGTRQELYEDCTTNTESSLTGCMEFLRGVWNGLMLGTQGKMLCGQGGAAIELREKFLAWHAKHPFSPEADLNTDTMAAFFTFTSTNGCKKT